MKYTFRGRQFDIKRYPPTQNHSLRPWSAADEHLLKYLEEEKIETRKPIVMHDRFGFLTTALDELEPTTILVLRSQQKAVHRNLSGNDRNISRGRFAYPLEDWPVNAELGILKIPKSLDLFRLYLAKLSFSLNPEGMALAGFMTRHFTPQMLEIAGEYFGSVNQSKAWKKSRVLILKEPKMGIETPLVKEIEWKEGKILSQYLGVFSGKRIDSATQFLLEKLEVGEEDERMLDLGCGNGVLALGLKEKVPGAEIHLVDDSWLAVESAKINLQGKDFYFHYTDTLTDLKELTFDRVICNPPFHFEHEIDISISLQLFKEVADILNSKGHFMLVANRHLNYQTHLEKLFSYLDVVAVNDKFVIYDCVK